MYDPDQLFAQKEQQYGLPSGYLKRTWQIESGAGTNLYNPGSGAAGHFQFVPSMARAYGLSDPYDLAQSADAAARLARDNMHILQRNGISDPTGGMLYLAHQQGGGGAVNLLKGGGSAAGAVGASAVASNGGDPNAPAQHFANAVMSKFDGTQPTQTASGYGNASPTPNLPMPATPPPGLLGGGTQQSSLGGLGLLSMIDKQRQDQVAQLDQQAATAPQAHIPRTPFMGFDNGLLG